MTGIFRGSVAQRAVPLLLAIALSGCLDEKSQDRTAQAVPAAGASTPGIVNHPPEISGTPAAAVEAGAVYSFKPAARDADDDFLEFTIDNAPVWAQFSDESGELSGTPGEADVGETADITITVTDGRDTRAVGPFRIRIHPRDSAPAPANTAPTISGTPAAIATVGEPYSFQPSASDTDGDRLSFSISNRPSWASFDSSTGRLSGTPALKNVAAYANIVISVNDGRATTSLPAFAIEVHPSNRAPTISGTPASSVLAGQTYSFRPAASDPDGDRLSYTIENRPSWAEFDSASGSLSGTPAADDVGQYANITIAVSDGSASSALPGFSIDVQAAPVSTPPNQAPTISGTPPASVVAGAAYTFTPRASDADGDTLGYSIRNKPSWADFDTATGRLSGTPGGADTGTYAGIEISVSDSRESAALPAFAITVSPADTGTAKLSWVAPTQNTDGSALGNLAGFRITYGTSAAALGHSIDITSPGAVSYTVTGLASGTWYFAVKAYTNTGVESDLSNIASKTIP